MQPTTCLEGVQLLTAPWMGEKLLAALLALMDVYGSGVMDVQQTFVG